MEMVGKGFQAYVFLCGCLARLSGNRGHSVSLSQPNWNYNQRFTTYDGEGAARITGKRQSIPSAISFYFFGLHSTQSVTFFPVDFVFTIGLNNQPSRSVLVNRFAKSIW